MKTTRMIILVMLTAANAFAGWSNVAFNTDTLEVKPGAFTSIIAGATSQSGASNWSFYPARQNVNIGGYDITNILNAEIQSLAVRYAPNNYVPVDGTDLEAHLKGIDEQLGVILAYIAGYVGNQGQIAVTPFIWETNSYVYGSSIALPNPTTATFYVYNTDTNTMAWSVATNATWFMCEPTEGVSTGELDEVKVIFTGSLSLATNLRTGVMTVSSTNAVNSPQNVSILWNKTRSGQNIYSNAVLWYSFDNETRLTNDVTPKPHLSGPRHGSVSNFAFYDAHSVHFDQYDSFIHQTIGQEEFMDGATAVTYAVWVKYDTPTNDFLYGDYDYENWMVSCATGRSRMNGIYRGMYVTNPCVIANFCDAANPNVDNSSDMIAWPHGSHFNTTGKWHRIVATYGVGAEEGKQPWGTMKLYYNGWLAKTVTNSYPNFRIRMAERWKIGPSDSRYWGVEDEGRWAGQIDDALILRNKAWTLSDVTNDYARGRTSP